ncbi:helix-turn-helix domain-containing protein [Escherichia coli]|nr:helix-turn-helix domain-containing protein [Escherichia coli]HAW9010785.1 helix-turn-helix domain-containing protein [Escherichia coli]
MSMHMMNEVWNVNLNSPIQKLVLMALAEKADDKGRAQVSRENIAKVCELPLHTTVDALNSLTRKGFVKRVDEYGEIYDVVLPEE